MSPTAARVARTDAGLASVLRVSVMRLRRRLVGERDPHNDLGIGQMAVLGALLRYGESSIGALADHEKVKPPSMTRTVTCLEEAGHVRRRTSEFDKRQVLVELTQQGRDVLEADRRKRDAWLAQRLAELTREEREILRAAAPILERLAVS